MSSLGPLHPAGGGDGRYGAGDQHEWDSCSGGDAEPNGEIRSECF